MEIYARAEFGDLRSQIQDPSSRDVRLQLDSITFFVCRVALTLVKIQHNFI